MEKNASVSQDQSACASNTFVALSRFTVANGMVAEVQEAFRRRPHLVDGAPGFLRMEVMSPVERSEEFWLITYWTDRQSFEIWHRSHMYHESHRGIPKGLKLVPAETSVSFFTMVAT